MRNKVRKEIPSLSMEEISSLEMEDLQELASESEETFLHAKRLKEWIEGAITLKQAMKLRGDHE